jgi:hypothetical protein
MQRISTNASRAAPPLYRAVALPFRGPTDSEKKRFVRLASCMCLVAIALVALRVEYEHLATLIIASAASGASYGAFSPCSVRSIVSCYECRVTFITRKSRFRCIPRLMR